LKQQGATITPLNIPVSKLPQFNAGYNYEQGAFFDEFVRAGNVAKMTNPGRGNGFKSARLLNVVEYLQMSRIRMMSMMELANATKGFDVYFSAAPNPQGNRGAGGRGGPGAPEAAGAAGAAPAGGRGGRGGGGGDGAPPQPGPPNNNEAGYPGVTVVTSFSAPTEAAPAGLPQVVTLFGPPFKESEILFVAKSFQDVAQLHTKKPILKA